MLISFDFDSTMSQSRIRRLAEWYILQGHEIQILTSRVETHSNTDVMRIAGELQCPVHFTNGADKYRFLRESDVEIHYDERPSRD